MKIICDSCQTKYSIADEKVRGKVFKIKCKKCSHIIVVRGAAGEVAAPAVDEKETKVFDYSGYDNPSEAAAAMAASGGEEAVWHLVIDQEQVGPLTRAEVLDRFRTGKEEVFQVSTDHRGSEFQEEMINQKQRKLLMGILEQLDAREKDIILYRFGLRQGVEPQTLAQVGQQFGVTKERIRQLEARALRKLRQIAQEEKLDIPGI